MNTRTIQNVFDEQRENTNKIEEIKRCNLFATQKIIFFAHLKIIIL